MLENKISMCILVILFFVPYFRCLSTIPRNQYDKKLQIEISNGVLQGKHIVSEFKNISYYGFLGIPYAQPPIGDLRFRPPQPASNWTGILDARMDRSMCLQNFEGSENCLYLNVYTRHIEKLRENKIMLPVMVWIHGGSFLTGSSAFNLYGPDRLMEHDVIIVNCNYRLGVFGFLSTGDMALPGNYGLKDQIEALKWVQRNIQYFGGNSSQVTVFGESAGAASVHYMLQTPLASCLFQRAISESGSTLCFWSLYREPKKIAFRIAELAGIETNNTEELVTKLRSLEVDELSGVETVVSMEEGQNSYDDGLPFSPCIEPEHADAVVTKNSYTVLSSNQFIKVPLLTGFNSQESALLQKDIGIVRLLLAIKDAAPGTIVRKSMHIPTNITKIKVGQAIKSFYFGKGSAATAPIDDIFTFLSDDWYLRPIHKTVELHSKSVPVYFYRFSYETPMTYFGQRTFKGVAHSEELMYIWYMRDKPKDHITDSISAKIVKMWTNFAKTGNPTPTSEELLDNIIWPVTNAKTNTSVVNNDPHANNLIFLDINNRLTLNINPRQKAVTFWEDIFQKYPSVDGTY